MATKKSDIAVLAVIEPIIKRHLRGVDAQDQDAIDEALDAAAQVWSETSGDLFNQALHRLGIEVEEI